MFGLFKKRDPICGMKEEKGSGTAKHNHWFCSESCLKSYEQSAKVKDIPKGGCCH